MKTWVMLSVALSICLAGCVKHYYRVQDNTVTFYLSLPEGKDVYFAHSLDHYRLHKIKKNKLGVWELAVPSGFEFSYYYIVDGDMHVPTCEFKETDDFGGQNCIFVTRP
jgi:hypothetical protein